MLICDCNLVTEREENMNQSRVEVYVLLVGAEVNPSKFKHPFVRSKKQEQKIGIHERMIKFGADVGFFGL